MKHMHNSESYSNLNSQKSKNSRIINDITQQKQNKLLISSLKGKINAQKTFSSTVRKNIIIFNIIFNYFSRKHHQIIY